MSVRGDGAVRGDIRTLIDALDEAAVLRGGRGLRSTDYAMGGGRWRVHAGAGSDVAHMLDACAPLALRGADAPDSPEVDLDLHVWNDACDRVAPARLGRAPGAAARAALDAPANAGRGTQADLTGYSDAASHAFWMPAAGVLSVIDFERRRAHWWMRDAAQAPYYERAAPFRHILQWWMSSRRGALLHASAVAQVPRGKAESRGVLIVGPSGSGKSTTALACLAAGMQFTSDDYVLVDAATPPRAHMAYATSKIVRADLDRQRALAAHMLNLERVDEKPMMFVDRFAASSICTAFTITALVMPQVAHASRTRFAPVSGATMLRALAPSSLLLFPLAGAHALHRMGELCSQLPCFRAELADDAGDVASAFAAFVADPGNPGLRAVA